MNEMTQAQEIAKEVDAEYRTVTVALTDGTTSDVNQPIPAVRAGSKFTLCRSTSND